MQYKAPASDEPLTLGYALLLVISGELEAGTHACIGVFLDGQSCRADAMPSLYSGEAADGPVGMKSHEAKIRMS